MRNIRIGMAAARYAVKQNRKDALYVSSELEIIL